VGQKTQVGASENQATMRMCNES